MEKLSCIITSYNNLPDLKAAIDSVLRQTVRPDEVIISDDCSTDGSQQFIKDRAREYPEIKPVLREQNVGVAINRDLAIRAAASEFVTTLDGDDIYYPEKVEAELRILNEEPQAVVFSGVLHVDAEQAVIRRFEQDDDFSEVDDKLGLSELEYRKRVLHVIYRKGPMPRDMMFARQLFEDCGGFRHDLGLYEDWDLKMKLAFLAKDWRYSGVTGIGYRVHDKGLSSEDGLTHLSWQLDVLTGNRALIADLFGPEEVYKVLMMRIVKTIGFRGFQFVR